MKEGQPGKAVYRRDYAPYPWTIGYLNLHFDIHDSHTTVKTEMSLEGNFGDGSTSAIQLDGSGLELVNITIDGYDLDESRYSLVGEKLTIHDAPESCVLASKVRIRPAENSTLEGLYTSGDFLLTQCEAEGFRKITWFPDRPDVMTRYTVTIEADRERFPVLLSNGNSTESGDAGEGRHWVRWEDPFPKPSYLFALVAGDLTHVEDHFLTRSGRDVTLRVYVEKENIDRCDHAMESLINAMRWDEERFNLEYDLDIYNIVATNDFNMGAMENKSLNIFNSKYVLARPDTATDVDFQGIEGVIGHEYFHNWTGNRVTCQDWFQLTLKEGLTVFRDEEFSSDMQSRAVKRIQDVRDLRKRQFPEDAGPMAHPIRPDHYIAINNFYTATVYQKGAAIIRMYHTLLGEAGFQKGMRLYFERHDGQAVACNDFLAAMADANGVDLGRFSHWYSQSGTPEVTVETEYDHQARLFTLHLSQFTAPSHDQAEKLPLVIPFALGLLDSEGNSIPLSLAGGSVAPVDTLVLPFEKETQNFVFQDVPEPPVPSLLRNFSAPVKIHYRFTEVELATLIAYDTDPFARWEAAQHFAQDCILEQVEHSARGEEMQLNDGLAQAFGGLLDDRSADSALVAEALILPAEDYLAEQMAVVDVDGIHAAREFLRKGLAGALYSQLLERYEHLNNGLAYDKSPASIAARSLKNVCLSYLGCVASDTSVLEEQLAQSDNMTDTLAALRCLVMNDWPAAGPALAEFERRWRGDALVMDKWFVMQASKPGHDTIKRVRSLMEHPEFSIRNPNKVRALIGVFSMLNPTGFHAPDGAGYRFHADQVIALNGINPQVAARMASAFNRWLRYDESRKALMKGELQRIAAVEGLSSDVYEIVTSALK